MAEKPASLSDDMANNIPVQYLIDQIKDLKKDLKEEIGERFDEVGERFDKIEERLTGNEGVFERLTVLEVKMQQAAKNSSYPPAPDSTKKKKHLKEHAPALGAGMGVTGLLYGLVELANAYLKTK